MALARARRARRVPLRPNRGRAARAGFTTAALGRGLERRRARSSRRSSTSGRWPGSGTSTPTKRSGSHESIRFGPPASYGGRGGRRASARHPDGPQARAGPPGRDAAGLPRSRGELRADAARVPRLRTHGRILRPLRGSDREDEGRRARNLVLPSLPAGVAARPLGGQLLETALPVELPELCVTADRSAVDHDLRHASSRRSAPAGARGSPTGCPGRISSYRDRARREAPSRARSIRTSRWCTSGSWPSLPRYPGVNPVPAGTASRLAVVPRSWKTEAVVPRSIRYGEADRVLHLFTLERGRLGRSRRARARRRRASAADWSHSATSRSSSTRGAASCTRSPESTSCVRTTRAAPTASGSPSVISGSRRVLRLFLEQDANPRAFHALTRFLDVLDETAPADLPATPGLDPLVLSFQLKLLWLAGYLPHLTGCASCGEEGPLVGFSPQAGGAVCASCEAGAVPISSDGFEGSAGSSSGRLPTPRRRPDRAGRP